MQLKKITLEVETNLQSPMDEKEVNIKSTHGVEHVTKKG
jgi:hypothetical protein